MILAYDVSMAENFKFRTLLSGSVFVVVGKALQEYDVNSTENVIDEFDD